MAQRNPIPALIVNGLTAGIPAIIEAVKAKKAKKNLEAAEAIREIGNGQLGSAILTAAATNIDPAILIPEIPAGLIDWPPQLQYLWFGLAATGLITRMVGEILKAKAQKQQ